MPQLFSIFDRTIKFRDQDYYKLRKTNLKNGTLFRDDLFPPDNSSLFQDDSHGNVGIEWKRPTDLCSKPRLFVDGLSAHDVTQGEVGNCWFVAACSCIALHFGIWSNVIPDHRDQEWAEEGQASNYAGIFHFRFWRFGKWVDVVIDDFLPTRNGQLIYIHSKSNNEFWSALLEKAYAKICGCYQAMDGGMLSEALTDLTGGISEPLNLTLYRPGAEKENESSDLFKTVYKEHKRKSLMSASIPARSSSEMEAEAEMGLIRGHAYGISGVVKVVVGENADDFLSRHFSNPEKMWLIRLRNPWGAKEWRGAFSDGSPEWQQISDTEKKRLGLTFEDDGEFWMSFDDFCNYFEDMVICRVLNTSILSIEKTWSEVAFHGTWSLARDRAGGCANNRDTFIKNPQYMFNVTTSKPDEVLVTLLQKSERCISKTNETIGFTIVRVEENRRYRMHDIDSIVNVVKSSTFKNSRSIFLRVFLDPGRYAVIPSSFDPGVEASFLLRICCSQSPCALTLDAEHPAPLCSCLPIGFFANPVRVFRLTVFNAKKLQHQDTVGGADPYLIIKYDRVTVQSPVIKDTLDPEWNSSSLFYQRPNVTDPIVIHVYNENSLRDKFMGQYSIENPSESTGAISSGKLIDPNQGDQAELGSIYYKLVVSDDLDKF